MLLQILTCLMSALLVSVTSKVTDEEYASMPQIFHVEDYDSCMMLKEKALYCYITFELTPLDNANPPEVWKIIKESSSSPLRYRHDLIRQFICVPRSCPNIKNFNYFQPRFVKDVNDCFNKKYQHYELKGAVKNVSCRTSDPVYQIDLFDYSAAGLFAAYLLLVALVSLFDLFKRYDTEENYKKFKDTSGGKVVTSFSIPSNWSKLRSFPTGSDFEKLRNVQGIRVYMTFVVIMVHTCLSFTALPVSNPQVFEELNENPEIFGEFPKRGIFLLSFHFMMSTWMLMNSMLAKSDRNEDIDIKFITKSVIKRYVRFLPTVAVVVGFYATWFRHIPFGPYWEGICDESERCRKNWWANILFIQNYVDRYNMCHIISWYLAVEMQYYILSLFIIMIMLRYRDKIPVMVFLLLILNMSLAFLDHFRHGYPSTLTGSPEDIYKIVFNKKPQWHDHFASYHANFAGSIIGLGFGYYYYKYKNQQLFTKQIYILLWWILTFGLIGSVFCLPLLMNVDTTTIHSAAWVAITRPLFSTGMGLLVLGLSHGLGGFVKWICEWNPLQILAKLSYCVYISHTIFQNIRVGLMRSPAHINYYVFAISVLSDIFISFLAAVLLTLLFEMPASELANRIFRSERSKEKKKD